MTTFQEAFDDADSQTLGGGSWDEALSDDPTSGGQVEDESAVGEAVEGGPTYFDIDQYGDQLVKITVGGVDQVVPLKDLPQGFMRTADYTQKTQGLAEERRNLAAAETLARAYDKNPVETVRFLAQQQGLTLAEAKAQAEAAVAEQDDTWANEGYDDPRLAAVEAQLQEIQGERARLELDRSLDRLSNLYGEDFNADEVVARAVELQTTDIEGVYKMIAFDRNFGRQQAAKQVEQQRVEQDQKITAQKATLGQTVTSGASFAGAGSVGSAPIRTVAQALEQALAGSDFQF